MDKNKSGKVIVNEDYVVKWVFVNSCIDVQLYKHGALIDSIIDQIIEDKN